MRPLALSAALLAALLVLPARAEDTAADEYARALDKENTDRDINGAMEIYKGIVKRHKDEEEIAAKAQYRIAECWEKLGVERDAREAYEALVRDFPSQTALVDKAKERLAAMGGKPVEKKPEDVVARKLETLKIDLDFTDSTLPDILDFVSEFALIPCVLDPAAEEAASKQLTFSVQDLALGNVLNLLAETSHTAFVNRNGILVWTTPARANDVKQLPRLEIGENAPDEDRKVARSIEAIRISLNLSETPLPEAMSFIREVTQLNVVLDQGLEGKKVSLKLDEACLRDVFELVGFLNKLDIRIQDGAVLLKAK
ncbi:MAG: tetratricopeptide repeat protein [Planctomycetia bacterium]|nr:tetratricopeptide repeat protein [Planctomycetia bacterium]